MQTWTLLSLTQEFCKRRNLPIPADVVVSSDEQVTQIWGLLNEGITQLLEAGDWPQMDRSITFTHGNGLDYLAINLYSPNAPDVNQPNLGGIGTTGASIKYPTRMTLWTSSQRIPVAGPLSDQDWASMIALQLLPAVYSWRMNNFGICIYPVPTNIGGTQFYLNCTIREPIVSADGMTYKEVFSLNNDVCLLPANIVLADLRWRWNYTKGLAYAEEFRMCQEMILGTMAKGSGAGMVYMDNKSQFPQVVSPGLLIPAGNWTNLVPP